VVEIYGKDGRSFRFKFDSLQMFWNVREVLQKVSQITKVNDLYAYQKLKAQGVQIFEKPEVWQLTKKEFKRMKIKDECFRLTDVFKTKGQSIDYLYTVIVPEGIEDAELIAAS